MNASRPPEELEAAFELLVHAPELFCFLDYDGTLAPIAARPELARPLPGVERVLGRLIADPSTSVAIVSGRTVRDLRSLLNVPGAHYVGSHGAEIVFPSGESIHQPLSLPAEQTLRNLRNELQRGLQPFDGVWVEDKGTSVACHYRQASACAIPQLRDFLSSLEQRYAGKDAPIEAIYGHCVCEFRPRGIHKGAAVRLLLDTVRPGALPFYAGDDRTDEDAFAILSPPAVTVRIGSPQIPTHAGFWAPSPEVLRDFLDALATTRATSRKPLRE